MKSKLALSMFAIVVLTACSGSKSPVAPAPIVPVVPECQAHNTATITFGNQSINSTYTIAWDGTIVATLGPGQYSKVFTEAAGVAHLMQFKYSNSNLNACSSSTPTLVQCSTNSYSCKF